MSNLYFTSPTDVEAATLARSTNVNDLDAAVDAAFDKLPTELNLKRGTTNYAVDTGTADAYLVSLPYTPSEYIDGLHVRMRPLNTNTGASTINVNSLGVKSIRLIDSSVLTAGDITAGGAVDLTYSTATGYFHVAANSNTAATSAAASAVAAAASASAASGSASSASSSASTATTQAGTATTQAGLAAADRVQTGLDAAATAADVVSSGTNASTATTQAGTATTQAGIATAKAVLTAADAVATAADRVQTGLDRTAASNSASDAASAAAAVKSTSTTSLAIGTGSKTFTTQSGKQYAAGMFVLATSDADPANYMHGQVTSYSSTSLVVNVLGIGGSGTKADWTIAVSGSQGPTGATGTVDASALASVTHAATSKSTPVDADELPIVDSVASNALKKLTFANLKAAMPIPSVSGGATVTTSAVDVTLTAASTRLQSINMTVTGKVVNMPNATTLSEGGELFVFSANGYDYALVDTSANVLAIVTKGKTTTLYLSDNSTSAGVWIGGHHGPANTLLSFGAATTLHADTAIQTSVCMLSATKGVAAYRYPPSGYLYAVVFTVAGATITPGTPVAMNAADSRYPSICALTDSQAIVGFYNHTTGKGNAVVINVSGTVPTPGTIKALDNSTLGLPTAIAPLSSTTAVFAYWSATTANICVHHLTVASSVITTGATLDYNASTPIGFSLCPLTDTKILLAYGIGTPATYGNCLTLSGTTLTHHSGYSCASAAGIHSGTLKVNSHEAVAMWAAPLTSVRMSLTGGSDVSVTGNGIGQSISCTSIGSLYGAVGLISPGVALIGYTSNPDSYGTAILYRIDSGLPYIASDRTVFNADSSGYFSVASYNANGAAVMVYQGTSGYLQAIVAQTGVAQ